MAPDDVFETDYSCKTHAPVPANQQLVVAFQGSDLERGDAAKAGDGFDEEIREPAHMGLLARVR